MKTPLVSILSVALWTLLISPALSNAESKGASEQAGANLFRDKGCAYCHSQTLQGTQKGPSLANVRRTMKAPQIANQIENGGQKMPPFGDSLSHDEVTQLVDFLRAKHRPGPIPISGGAPLKEPLSNPAQ